jgi:hypothetical protein
MFWQDVDRASVIRHSRAMNRFLGRCWGFMEMASYEKYKPIIALIHQKYKPIIDLNHQKYKPKIKTRSVDPSSKVVAMTVRRRWVSFSDYSSFMRGASYDGKFNLGD